MKILITSLIILSSSLAIAQTATISGRVIDSQTLEALPFTNVFINNTTIGTSTNDKGEFILRNVPAGTSEVIYSFVGYQTYQVNVSVKEGEEVKVNIKLIPLQSQLAEVQINESRDKVWERQLKKFEKIFFGNSELAKECKITNPYVIDFSSGDNNKFLATASAPIDIQNMALGYHITYYLKDFWWDGIHYSIVGNTKFEELAPANQEEAMRWMKNRRDSYLGSTRHLFYSLLEGKSKEEGFLLYTDRAGTTTTRLSSFNQDLEKNASVVVYKTEGLVSPSNSPYKKTIAIKNRVEVHYINKRATEDVYKDIGHAVSWLEAKHGFVLVNSDGVVLNSRELVASGDMGNARVSTILPLNYQPQHSVQVRTGNQITADRLFETVYLQTNKPFFYPGEIVWFKGYMNYRIRGMADSLSAVLYVDLINADRTIIESKTLMIDSGRVSGNIKLSPNLANGNYALVAYTNWMRNYGEQYYFTKVIPVLNIYDRPVADAAKTTLKNSMEVELTFNKEKYHVREKVNVSVSLRDENDLPVKATLSVAITDATQVPEVSWAKNDIRNEFTIPSELKPSNDPFRYRIEHGITWDGEFQSGLKKPEQSNLTVVRGSFEEVRKVTTATNGKFSLTDLYIQDSALYSFQALRGNDSYGKVIALPREHPLFSFNAASYTIPIERKSEIQRNLSLYEIPSDAILLSGVEVKSTKLASPDRMENAYGKAEAVIDGEEIAKFGSIEQLLRMKAPGFRLYNDGNQWLFLSNRPQDPLSGITEVRIASGAEKGDGKVGTFVGEFPEPLLTIDNQINSGAGRTVGDRLMALLPNDIERIEVSSVSASYLGANGKYGLIAVFMKKGVVREYNKFQPLFIKGFNTTADFKGPDYDNKNEEHTTNDFRSTLYWGKELRINPKGQGAFSFYTSDLPGHYRIVIEGVTEKGKPIHYSQLMTVEAN